MCDYQLTEVRQVKFSSTVSVCMVYENHGNIHINIYKSMWYASNLTNLAYLLAKNL